MTTMFEAIQDTFFEMDPSNAFGLKLSLKGVDFFSKDIKLTKCIYNGNMFNVLAFQELFLTILEQIIPKVELPENIQLGVINSSFDISKCKECLKVSKEEGTWMHCKDCFPLLAQTKRGVVLNLIWSKGDLTYKVSIDLVPM